MQYAIDYETQTAWTQLAAGLPPGMPIDFASVFPTVKGWGVEKRNRMRVELLKNAAPVLALALRAGEVVLHVIPCTVNFWWEQFVMGAWAQAVNRTALIITPDRLLLVQLSGSQPASFVNQIPRAAIRKISGLLSLVIRLGNGSLTLSAMARADKAVLKAIVSNDRAVGGFEHLCPACFAPYTTCVESCSRCGARFKSPATAGLRSLLLPGLGGLYLGHRGLAVLQMFSAFVVWAVAVALATQGLSEKDPGLVALAIGLLVFVNGGHALVSRGQAKKGLRSVDGKLPAPRGMTAGF
jgi:hypothetical protein